MPDRTSSPDEELLLKLNVAVAAANEVEKTVETAKAELVSRSKVVGTLLLEAKTLHPAVGDFYAFLKRVDGLKLSRAYDLMRLAGGRVTDEELRQDARERQQKSRAKTKLPKPAPTLKPEPEPDSVTDPPVTESAGASAEARKTVKPDADAKKKTDKESSARALAEFDFACHQYLPKMTEKDLRKAQRLFFELYNERTALRIMNAKAEAA